MADSASINLLVGHFNDPRASAKAAETGTVHTLYHHGFIIKHEEKYNLQIFYDTMKEQMCRNKKPVKQCRYALLPSRGLMRVVKF